MHFPLSFSVSGTGMASAPQPPPKTFQSQKRSWHDITAGLEAAARSAVGPAGRPVMLISTATAATEPMAVTKVMSTRANLSACRL